jgi:transglutaminase-like putative cysteine protease
MDTALNYTDGFGNQVHLVTAEVTDQKYQIIAEGDIETANSAGVVSGLNSTLPDTVYLRQTLATQPDWAMKNALAQLSTNGTVLERAHALMQFVHGKIVYEVGASVAETTAAEAFATGRGVCQDHAHVMVGMARALNIPSRYVTGYLVTGIGASSAAAHAWAEILIPDLGWVGFDAANGQSPTEHYVRLAAGLDAGAVAPVKGSRRGAYGTEQLTVAVRAEIAQQ